MNKDTPRTNSIIEQIKEFRTASAIYSLEQFSRLLERELTEANEYADKLAAGLPDGMLPKDVEVLREANLELAAKLTAVTEQRDKLAELSGFGEFDKPTEP